MESNDEKDRHIENGQSSHHSSHHSSSSHSTSSHSHQSHHHHHKHKLDSSERMKNRLLLNARRRKVIEKVLFFVALVVAILVIIACIAVNVFDIQWQISKHLRFILCYSDKYKKGVRSVDNAPLCFFSVTLLFGHTEPICINPPSVWVAWLRHCASQKFSSNNLAIGLCLFMGMVLVRCFLFCGM